MTFRSRNAYYMRISTNVILPLFLYLDEQHVDWMSDIVLQHVLADLRPLVVPKLHAEKDVHFGLTGVAPTKRGTVEVHRGETYQFAYFFRRTEPHTVLHKSRYFVTAPFRTEVASKQASEPVNRTLTQKKRSRTEGPLRQSKRKRAKTKGKGKPSENNASGDEWTAGESEEDMDDTGSVSRRLRPVRKQCRIIPPGAYQVDVDDDVEVELQDISMGSSHDEASVEDAASPATMGEDPAAWGTSDQPSPSPDATDIELVEEEERKPKPLLRLKYQSFAIPGHCLCVVVEPWPPQRTEKTLRSVHLATSLGQGTLESLPRPPNEPAVGQRAQTPLFFPEDDRVSGEVPIARERTLPPVPLFRDAASKGDGCYIDDDLMYFSQTLHAAGHMHAITADDDDDLDGAVLFGDADEVRELL